MSACTRSAALSSAPSPSHSVTTMTSDDWSGSEKTNARPASRRRGLPSEHTHGKHRQHPEHRKEVRNENAICARWLIHRASQGVHQRPQRHILKQALQIRMPARGRRGMSRHGKQDRVDVLVTQGWGRSAYNVVRSLGRQGLSVAVGTDKFSSMAVHSRYASSSFQHSFPIAQTPEFIGEVRQALTRYAPKVYLPLAEDTYIIAKYIDHLKGAGAAIPIASFQTIRTLHKKDSLARLAESLGIPTPRDGRGEIRGRHSPLLARVRRSRRVEAGQLFRARAAYSTCTTTTTSRRSSIGRPGPVTSR